MIKKIDHLVITTANMENCISFYKKLGFTAKNTNERWELFAGDFKINVHFLGKELSPHAKHIQTGSADLCLEVNGSIDYLKNELEKKNIELETGTVERTGVKGKMKSLYLRDPDGNLLEFCSYE
ncbi:VOC family protein [Bacillus badius]|uniref:Biphenyl-2,3-diol 1,2-dioxygenase III n=1 Tax=Bacillus badius TaxID=1455 RepID=A0ABR5ARS1_BACBA|nr:VOC family protein [Bacillus badius]KIL72430.1 biphenyl-2,3-diol 1,2-dioxygenase III-related protein [Bacillus badius]KIL77325.1 biphenyl-2,3-diol 1,2-dioxygenase III [Bacillus badius]MED4718551.1 VOC family protein [Bacillus badius]